MFRVVTVVFLCFVSLLAAADYVRVEELPSMQGVIDRERSSPDFPKDTLRVAGKPVFVDEGNYISLYRKFQLGKAEVVLFGVNCGGTGCPNDDLHFLILRQGEKPQVVSTEDFHSVDGTIAPRLEDGKVIVDLGYERGQRKEAALMSDGVVAIHLTPQPVSPMDLDGCKWMHEFSMQECIAAKGSSIIHCESPQEWFSGAMSRGLAALANHPGFVAKNFDAYCKAACRTGKAIAFDPYKAAVCSIQ